MPCNKWLLAAAVCLLHDSVWSQEPPVLPRGHVFFSTGFEGADALKGWSGNAGLEPGFEGGQALCVERPAGSPEFRRRRT